MEKITVDIWSDIVCPWRHLGKRRFDLALAGFERADDVDVRLRAFELDPHGRPDDPRTTPERMRDDLGMTPQQAAAGLRRITAMAADAGLDYHLDRARPVNSFDAHRLVQYAASAGVGDRVQDRLLRAFTSEGVNIADRGELVRLAAEAGLDADAAARMLAGDAHADDVRADEELGRRVGVSGVPTFLVGGRFLLAGAQPVEVFADALRRAGEQDATP
ncbi:DsbA family oxidoreductase [Jiangella alkaliphila]|uniref:DsbA family oxidoreductase n=1 Tax=Jiangella alkaliphila TaxID=419479 RepID=UPI00062985B2|nr:DsbA family oxidoreductase [Jiangella alkaliphila]